MLLLLLLQQESNLVVSLQKYSQTLTNDGLCGEEWSGVRSSRPGPHPVSSRDKQTDRGSSENGPQAPNQGPPG